MGIQFSDKGWYVEGVVQGSQAERCEALRGIGSRLFLTHIQNQPIAPGGVLADDDTIRSMLRPRITAPTLLQGKCLIPRAAYSPKTARSVANKG